jgi:hypothetical protein
MSTFLRFGDQIMLHCIENNPPPQDGDKVNPNIIGDFQGFLSGIGFADEGVYVQLERKDNLRTIQQPSDLIEKLPNARTSRHYIFQVTPKLSFESHEDYQKTLMHYRELLQNSLFAKREIEKYRSIKK